MVITLELPVAPQRHQSARTEALIAYERKFGSAPDWLEDVAEGALLSLLRVALRRGAPLVAADYLH